MRRLRTVFIGAIFAILVSVPGLPAHAVGVGEKTPHQLNVPDQHGQAREFNTLKGGKGLILLFTRSLDW